MAAERLVAALALIAATGCSTSPACDNRLHARVPSPDGARDALLYTRACGATTSESVQLSVVARGGAPVGIGNVLVADGIAPAAVSIRWLAGDVLAIDLPAAARTFHAADAAGGVRIVYRRD